MEKNRNRKLCSEQLESRRLLAGDIAPFYDINQQYDWTQSSNIQDLEMVGDTLYFTARTEAQGTEIWKSDGTREGTSIVKDLALGRESPYPKSLTNVNGVLYFSIGGYAIWKTDGTDAGFERVADVGMENPVSFLGQLFFYNRGTNSLWKSDGTQDGTVSVASVIPSGMFPIGNQLYFVGSNVGDAEGELWVTDGTTAGTRMVSDIRIGPGASFPANFTNVNGQLYFTADDGVHGVELWNTDGTAEGTFMVGDLLPGLEGSNPSSLVNANGILYFAGNDGAVGNELRKLNANGEIELVVDLRPGSSNPKGAVASNGGLYFSADRDPDPSFKKLYFTDGTSQGTFEISVDLGLFENNLTSSASTYSVSDFISYNNDIYFTAGVAYSTLNSTWTDLGVEFFYIDTSANIASFVDINYRNASSNPAQLLAGNGAIFMVASSGVIGPELWKSDGTISGTALVKDITNGTASSIGSVLPNTGPGYLTQANGRIFFAANNGITGNEMWVLEDGIPYQFHDFSEPFPIETNGNPRGFSEVNDELVFHLGVLEVWKTDGEEEPTLVRNLQTSGDYRLAGSQTKIGGLQYFAGYYSSNPTVTGGSYQLFRTDGTHEGTLMLTGHSEADSQRGLFMILAEMGGFVYFFRTEGPNWQLWRTDGTIAGTQLVDDIGSGWWGPSGLTAGNGKLFFNFGGDSGIEPWISDGVPGSTRMLADLEIGGYSSYAGGFTNVADTVYFAASTSSEGAELWRTDGTELGTVRVKDIFPGSSGSLLTSEFENVNGVLYFTANDGVHGRELWKSDGTEEGTVLVRDVAAGPNSSLIDQLTAARGELYFVANDGTHGFELWKSGGTAESTEMVADIAEGDSNPKDLVVIDDFLYLSAFTNTYGREMYRFELRQDLQGSPGLDVFTVSQVGNNVNVSLSTNLGSPVDLGTFPLGSSIALNGLGGDRDRVVFLGANASDNVMVNASGVNFNGTAFTLNGIEDLTLDGGQGSDSISVTGRPIPAHVPKVGSVAAKNNLLIFGGEGDDTFSLNADFALGKIDLSDIGGSDTISLAGTSANATLNLGLKTLQAVTPNLALLLASNLAFENVIGGMGNDTLTGNTLANRITGSFGNDTLIGMTGNDRYIMDGSAGTETITDSSGIDTIDYSTSNLALNVNLLTTTSQSLNGTQNVVLGTSIIEGFVGSQSSDLILGNNSANMLEGAGGDDNLQGGLGNDTYVFNADSPLGTDTINDATGLDTLDFSPTLSNGVNVSLGVSTAQVVNSNLSLILSSAGLLDNLVGSQANDTLIGNNGINQLTGLGGNDSLQGMGGNDTYWFANNMPMGTDTIDDSAGTSDLLDFSKSIVGVSVHLGLTTPQVVTPNLSLIFAGTTQIENVTGSPFADTITGNELKNKIIGGAGDDSLNGGLGDDQFPFDTDVLLLGTDTIYDDGGVDTLDFSTTTTRTVTIDIGDTTTQSVNSNLSLVIVSNMAFENLIGGSLNDTLIGNAGDNRLTGRSGDDLLVGGVGNDSYSFDADLMLGTDTLDESAGGLDTIDFTGTTMVGITIDLSVPGTQAITGGGSLNLVLGSGISFERVIGSSQNDTIHGNASNNILQGMNGNDNLHGGDGRDLIIGGTGADIITGGDGDDLLAVGTTSYDANLDKKLFQVFAEWTGANTYATRVNNLKTGAGVPSFAKTAVVKKDTGANTLSGGLGDDFFYANAVGTGIVDSVLDKSLMEVVEEL